MKRRAKADGSAAFLADRPQQMITRWKLRWLSTLVIAAACTLPVLAQTAQTADAIDGRLLSRLMAREMPYRVLLPQNYKGEKNSSRYPVVYLLHGLTGHYLNWTDKTGIAAYALKHGCIIVSAEGDDGWYTDSPTKPNNNYESYIVRELVPEIDSKYRTYADRDHRFIAGLSMGGYGSIKYALKYPEMFSLVGSFSGALAAAKFTEKTNGNTGRSVDVVYGTDGSKDRDANDIFLMVRELTPDKIKLLPFIYLSCGTEDTTYFPSNRAFSELLTEKKVPHEYRERPGRHDWKFWDDQVREFLDLVERKLKQ